MNIIKSYLTNNLCYKIGEKITPRGIMLHSVGCNVESAKNFISSWNNDSVEVMVHAFVEANGNVYHTLPWEMKAWHAGSGRRGSCNDTHISVEMCEPKTVKYTSGGKFTIKDIDYTRNFVLKTYEVSVELFSYLCFKYNLDPMKDKTVISHREGHLKEIASNHGDPEHLWNIFGLDMNKFREDVMKKMQKEKSNNKNNYVHKTREIIINNIPSKYDCLIDENRVYMKVRDLEKIGAKVDYDDENKKIIINI